MPQHYNYLGRFRLTTLATLVLFGACPVATSNMTPALPISARVKARVNGGQ